MLTISRSGAGKTVPSDPAAEKSVHVWTDTRAPPSRESYEDTVWGWGWQQGQEPVAELSGSSVQEHGLWSQSTQVTCQQIRSLNNFSVSPLCKMEIKPSLGF